MTEQDVERIAERVANKAIVALCRTRQSEVGDSFANAWWGEYADKIDPPAKQEPKKWEPAEGEYWVCGNQKTIIRRTEAGFEQWIIDAWRSTSYPACLNCRPLAASEAIVEGDNGEPVLATIGWSPSNYGSLDLAVVKASGYVVIWRGDGRLYPYVLRRLYHFGQPDGFDLAAHEQRAKEREEGK